MKQTLYTKHIDRVSPFLTNGATDPATYGILVKKLHTICVDESIKNLGTYRLLDESPLPKISSTEASLTHQERTTLAQL